MFVDFSLFLTFKLILTETGKMCQNLLGNFNISNFYIVLLVEFQIINLNNRGINVREEEHTLKYVKSWKNP